ncbi:hypothetical protein LCGC14_3006610, partial [marine sediment metagenome]
MYNHSVAASNSLIPVYLPPFPGFEPPRSFTHGETGIFNEVRSLFRVYRRYPLSLSRVQKHFHVYSMLLRAHSENLSTTGARSRWRFNPYFFQGLFVKPLEQEKQANYPRVPRNTQAVASQIQIHVCALQVEGQPDHQSQDPRFKGRYRRDEQSANTLQIVQLKEGGKILIGFFQIHRSLFDHPIWTKEQFTWAQAWLDLIGNANFKSNSFFIKDTEIKLGRGQIAWSQITMC